MSRLASLEGIFFELSTAKHDAASGPSGTVRLRSLANRIRRSNARELSDNPEFARAETVPYG
jgi:hypothetical protein